MKKQQNQKLGKRIALVNLIAQSGIITTGAIVRLTGSGLGCPTWPECAPGSLVPTPTQVEGFHKVIEFGNRILTFVVLLAAIAVFVISLYQKNKKLKKLTFLPIFGTLFQAILGGITVLTGLNPFIVMAHFLVSIVLVAVSLFIYQIYLNNTLNAVFNGFIKKYINILVLVGAFVIILGTITTGSGPHSGDEIAARFNLDIRDISVIHADSVFLFIGLTLGLYLATIVNKDFSKLRKHVTRLIVISFTQGLIGYIQWFTGLPWLIVGLHVLGAVLTWIAIVNIKIKSSDSFLNSFK